MLLLTSAGQPEDAERLPGPADRRLPDQAGPPVGAVRRADEGPGAPRASRTRAGPPQAGREPATASPAGEDCAILLAEDHPVNQKVAVRMLERLGHSVVVAADGRQALRGARRRPTSTSS